MSGMTFDLEREIRGQTSHTIVGLNSVIHYLVLQHEVHLKDSFTTLGNKLMENDKPRFKVLVITSLNVATSAQGVELKKVIEGTEKLLHKNFSSEKGDAKTYLICCPQIPVTMVINTFLCLYSVTNQRQMT
jgi:hypothetical protein